jgi:hypothetical protein
MSLTATTAQAGAETWKDGLLNIGRDVVETEDFRGLAERRIRREFVKWKLAQATLQSGKAWSRPTAVRDAECAETIANLAERLVGDSRSRSPKGKERKEGGLVEVWKLPEPSPRRWIVEGLVPEGALTILFGDGGLGKSYLVLYVASCILLGLPIAGRSVEKRIVLYLDAELDEEEFRRRAYVVARGLDLERPPEGLFYWRLSGSLIDPRVRAQALTCARECKAGLVVVDSLTVASSGIDPKEARDIIGLLKSLESLGTVLAVDHIKTPELRLIPTRPTGAARRQIAC